MATLQANTIFSGVEFNKLCKYPLFKLTNESELHHGIQYQDGPVTDTKLFNPTGSCSPGGLYFFSYEQIFHWESYGVKAHWIRPVIIPGNAQVYIEDRKYKADKLVLGPRERFDPERIILEAIRVFSLEELKADDWWAFRMSADNGHKAVVELLLTLMSDSQVQAALQAYDWWVFRMSAENGHKAVVELLLAKMTDIQVQAALQAYDWWVFRMSAENGHKEVVELLLTHMSESDVQEALRAKDWYTFRMSAGCGHKAVAELLLSRLDTTVVAEHNLASL